MSSKLNLSELIIRSHRPIIIYISQLLWEAIRSEFPLDPMLEPIAIGAKGQ